MIRFSSFKTALRNMSTLKPLQKEQENQLMKIFTSQSVKDRINTFRNLSSISQDWLTSRSTQNNAKQHLQVPSIRNPEFLHFDSAKNLSQFIKTNKIAPNIRILHALAHIEYNAFMSYTDTYFTLSGQIKNKQRQQQFKAEMKRIAIDEGDHFCLLNDRLQQLGWKYGSIPVIDQLCLAIQETKTSLVERMARISLLHQGRGMKAITKLMSQLRKEKDQKSIEILEIIQKEEVFHFQNGVKWFKYICYQQNMNFDETLQKLIERKQFRYLDVQQIKNAADKFNF